MRFFIVATALSIASAAVAGPTIDTSSGRVKGFSTAPGVTAFLGIPFAAPPVGALRFAPPRQFRAAYKDIIDGTKFSASCWRLGYRSAIAPEDPEGLQGEQREKVARRSALRRLPEVEDVANTVEFLLGEGGKSITGTVLTVDAGSTA